MPEPLLDAMWNDPKGPFIPTATVEKDNDIFYWLFRGISIGKFDLNKKVNVDGWPLTRWPQEYIEPEIAALYERFDIKPDMRFRVNNLGCLAQTPLRYGDIDQNGNNELVLLLQDQHNSLTLTVFSTQNERTIFSARLATYDAINNYRQTLPEGRVENASDPLANRPGDGQYLSLIAEEYSLRVKRIEPARVSLAKVYFGDFNDEEQSDILLWSKLYRSRPLSDDTPGFEHRRDTLIHYRFTEGQYQPQDTEQDIIRGWLTENDLTWQKGYPSKSECEGEEGELIREMHDPLLNDPEVLE